MPSFIDSLWKELSTSRRMLGEDLDIGFYAEDAYAAYVVQVATDLHLVPDFCSARGATVEVVFTGPFLSVAAFREAAAAANGAAGSPSSSTAVAENVWERLARQQQQQQQQQRAVVATEAVTLHAWIEKLNGAHKVQLTEAVFPMTAGGGVDTASAAVDLRTATDAETGATSSSSPSACQHHHRVVGNLDFLLHLSTRDILIGESNVSIESLSFDKYDCMPSPPVTADAEHDAAVAAEYAAVEALEQRDDVALARNAVDTLIQLARIAEEHVGEVPTIYVDEANQAEYIRFGE